MGKERKEKNPADAHRKELRKKQLQKAKKDRNVVREVRDMLNDPDRIDAEIKKAEQVAAENKLDKSFREKVRELKRMKEVALKKQLVMAATGRKPKEGPQRSIFEDEEDRINHCSESISATGTSSSGGAKAASAPKPPTVVDKRPENSVYFHPVYNPTGAPPPGQPEMYRSVAPSSAPVSKQQPQQQMPFAMPQHPAVAAAVAMRSTAAAPNPTGPARPSVPLSAPGRGIPLMPNNYMPRGMPLQGPRGPVPVGGMGGIPLPPPRPPPRPYGVGPPAPTPAPGLAPAAQQVLPPPPPTPPVLSSSTQLVLSGAPPIAPPRPPQAPPGGALLPTAKPDMLSTDSTAAGVNQGSGGEVQVKSQPVPLPSVPGFARPPPRAPPAAARPPGGAGAGVDPAVMSASQISGITEAVAGVGPSNSFPPAPGLATVPTYQLPPHQQQLLFNQQQLLFNKQQQQQFIYHQQQQAQLQFQQQQQHQGQQQGRERERRARPSATAKFADPLDPAAQGYTERFASQEFYQTLKKPEAGSKPPLLPQPAQQQLLLSADTTDPGQGGERADGGEVEDDVMERIIALERSSELKEQQKFVRSESIDVGDCIHNTLQVSDPAGNVDHNAAGGSLPSAEELMRRRYEVPAADRAQPEGPVVGPAAGPVAGPSLPSAEELMRRRYEVPAADGAQPEGPVVGLAAGPASSGRGSVTKYSGALAGLTAYGDDDDDDDDDEDGDDDLSTNNNESIAGKVGAHSNQDCFPITALPTSRCQYQNQDLPAPSIDSEGQCDDGMHPSVSEQDVAFPMLQQLPVENLIPACLPAGFASFGSIAPITSSAGAVGALGARGGGQGGLGEGTLMAGAVGGDAAAATASTTGNSYGASHGIGSGTGAGTGLLMKGPKIVKADPSLTAFVPSVLKSKRQRSSHSQQQGAGDAVKLAKTNAAGDVGAAATGTGASTGARTGGSVEDAYLQFFEEIKQIGGIEE